MFRSLMIPVLSLVVAIEVGAQAPQPQPPATPPASGTPIALAAAPDPMLVIVISDLHMGFGERSPGEWNPLEDFRWAKEFLLFLDEMQRYGHGHVTLVLAGDSFELWQSDKADCLDAKPTLGCSEAEAVARIKRILESHRTEMRALGEFAIAGDNKVVFIPGNHDAALLFQGVWDEVQRAAGIEDPVKAAARLVFEKKGYWASPGSRIVVDHGHQFDAANAFEHWPTPFAPDATGTVRLISPFGEQLVRQFFDPIETRHAVVDNISGPDALFYGVLADGIVGSARVFAQFTRLVALGTSLRQVTNFLNDTGSQPKWNLAEAGGGGVGFLAGSIGVDRTSALAQAAISTPDAEAKLAEVAKSDVIADPGDIAQLCQSRYVQRTLRVKEGGLAQDDRLCSRTNGDLGYLAGKVRRAITGNDLDLSDHIDDWLLHLPEVQSRSGNLVYVYCHTHA
ncbi:metallophosphoesterase, partial [Bradyrhizobium sp.]